MLISTPGKCIFLFIFCFSNKFSVSKLISGYATAIDVLADQNVSLEIKYLFPIRIYISERKNYAYL